MNIRLHKQARTTPAIRREIQESSLSERALAEKYGISRATVRKWRQRDSVEDNSNRPHAIHAAFSPLEEMTAMTLRTMLLLPLDDLLLAIRVLLQSTVSRSALDRCLRRHGISSINALISRGEQERRKTLGPGCVALSCIALPPFLTGGRKRSLYVAVDHTSRWVHGELRTARSATGFLNTLLRIAPFAISTVHTTDSMEFTDSLAPVSDPSAATMSHPFALLCQHHHLDHLVDKMGPGAVFQSLEASWHLALQEAGGHQPHWSLQQARNVLAENCQFLNQSVPFKVLGNRTPLQVIDLWQDQATVTARPSAPPLRTQCDSSPFFPSSEEEELFRLREENRRLRLEQELLARGLSSGSGEAASL